MAHTLFSCGRCAVCSPSKTQSLKTIHNSVATLSPIAARASDIYAISGPNYESISLYDSTAWASDTPKVLARFLALRSMSLSPSHHSRQRIQFGYSALYALGQLVKFEKHLGDVVKNAGKLSESPLHFSDNLGDLSPFTTALSPKFIVNVTVLLGIFIKFALVNSSNHGRSHNIHYRHHIMAL